MQQPIQKSLFFFAFLFLTSTLHGQASLDQLITRELDSLLSTYKYLHSHPELSYEEKETSKYLATELRNLGFEVTENVGDYSVPGRTSYGLVAVMRNGKGPTVMVRTDMDALPVEERTGLPYASRVKAKIEGVEVGVMHACGHDVHMTSFLGSARMLTQLRHEWAGTLLMIGQPAEERGGGAKAMLRDGLYTRFPKPDLALALHTSASVEAGKIAYTEGYALANVDSVDITIRGSGGHGAYPQTTKDPIVIAAQVVLALQAIVSREVGPLDPAVVTVGSIHGGTTHNVIPDEVHLQLTVRSYKPEVRKKILSAIDRITKGIAVAAGLPSELAPVVEFSEEEYTPSTYNDPELARRVASVLERVLGPENVVTADPVMAGEDFGQYSLEEHQIPICMFWLGAVDFARIREAHEKGIPLPSLHSSEFAPVPEVTIRTGVKAMTSVVLDLMER